jgi:hypothetical protein
MTFENELNPLLQANILQADVFGTGSATWPVVMTLTKLATREVRVPGGGQSVDRATMSF